MANHMQGINQSPQIQLKYIFGMNEQIVNTVQFQDDEHIVYVAGYQLVLLDLKDKSQIFFTGVPEYRGISCVSLSPRRQYLAVGTKGTKSDKGDSSNDKVPAIIIYEIIQNQRKKKQLEFREANIKKWESISFGSGHQEGKLLISLSSQIDKEGDIVVCFWHWDKNKCQSYVKIQPGPYDVKSVQFNFSDYSCFSVSGNKCFKYFQRIENQDEGSKNVQIKTLSNFLNGVPQDINQNYTCHAWLSCDQNMVICTSTGELLYCNANGEYFQTIKESPALLLQKPFAIECMAIHSKGFFVAGENAMIFQYKQTNDDLNPFECFNQFTIRSPGQELSKENIKIVAITIAPIGEDRLVCSLSSNQIYSVKIKKDNISSTENDEITEAITAPFHTGAILGMDICVRKPLIATCGADRSIKIWNYEEKTFEISWTYPDEATCLSFHPSGLHLVAAFADKLKLMNICLHNKQNRVDNKNFYKEYPVKQCKEIKFSNGGQYFAAVNVTGGSTQTIQIYKFYTGQAPTQLVFKGHTGRVKSIAWSKDDSILVSCDQSGLLYAGRLDEPTARIFDGHFKGIQLQSIALTNDNRQAFVSGNDRQLYICDLTTPPGTSEKKPLDLNLSSLALPSSNKLLFCSISDENKSSGAIRCYQYPLNHDRHNDYIAHDERGVEKIRITHDDKYLISAGKDGCVMIFEIKDKDARGKMRTGYSKPADEILVSRADLDDLKTNKEQLKQQQQEYQSSNNVLNLSSKDDQIKQLREQLQTNLQSNKATHDTLLERKMELEKKYEEDQKKQKEMNETEIQELDTSYQKKVMDEVEKFENAKHLLEIETTKNNKNKERTMQQQNAAIRALEEKNREELQDQKTQRERIQKEIDRSKKEYSEIVMQIKHEAEEEKRELEERYKKDNTNISESGLKAKSEVSITNKKIQEQERQRQEQEEDKKAQEEKKTEYDNENINLKKEIEAQKKDIQERDKQIGEKERKIYDLKKKSQELEKFKFVLDHKIKELKRDIGPREDEITRMKTETKDMDKKLKSFNHINTTLGTIVDELDTTQEEMKETIRLQREKISSKAVKIKQFKDDVYKTVQYILNYSDLAANTESLYITYVKNHIKKPEVDKEIDQEYQSQKKYLEKTVLMLKKNLQKDKDIHKQDNIRIIRENVELIKEINKLRLTIKTMTHGINKGPKSSKNEQEKRANKDMDADQDASEKEEDILSKKQIINQQKEELKQFQSQLELLKEENDLLENQIKEQEQLIQI